MIRRRLIRLFTHDLYNEIYRKFSKYSMIPRACYIDNLRLIEKFKDIEGDIVECGVWKGGMIAGIAALLGNNKKYFLFDSFEGLPAAQEIDGTGAINWQSDTTGLTYFNNCKAELKDAEEAMQISGAKFSYCIKGWFEQTLLNPEEYFSKISILRLDADWYDPMYHCLDKLYPLITPGGLIIIDDYYIWEGTSRAIHDYLSRHNLGNKIMQLDKSVAYIIK